MYVKSGFSLVEALISILIATILSFLVFQFASSFYSDLLNRFRFENIFLENYCALDHISRNVSMASKDRKDWQKVSDNEIVFRGFENKSVGYFLHGSNLYFITGDYKDGSWKGARKNLISKSVKEIKFFLNFQDSEAKNSETQNSKTVSGLTCKIKLYINGANINFNEDNNLGINNNFDGNNLNLANNKDYVLERFIAIKNG